MLDRTRTISGLMKMFSDIIYEIDMFSTEDKIRFTDKSFYMISKISEVARKMPSYIECENDLKKRFDSFDGGEIFCYMLDMLEEEKDSETAAVYIIAMMPILYDHLLEDEKEYAKSHPTLYS